MAVEPDPGRKPGRRAAQHAQHLIGAGETQPETPRRGHRRHDDNRPQCMPAKRAASGFSPLARNSNPSLDCETGASKLQPRPAMIRTRKMPAWTRRFGSTKAVSRRGSSAAAVGTDFRDRVGAPLLAGHKGQPQQEIIQQPVGDQVQHDGRDDLVRARRRPSATRRLRRKAHPASAPASRDNGSRITAGQVRQS